MTRVTPYQTGFEVDDSTLSPGTIFRKLDGSLWETLPNGDQQALGGGGSQPDVAVFPFTFATPGLAAAVTFYTPSAPDVAAGLWLLDAWIEVDTAFDGTTPLADVGTFAGGVNQGLWGGLLAAAVDLSHADIDGGDEGVGGAGILYNASGPSPPVNTPLSGANIVGGVTLGQYRVVPLRITATNPLKVVVSQDGLVGGAAIGGAAGAAKLCYRIGKA